MIEVEVMSMVFNKSITGYENEEEFARYLNGKTFGRVNPIFQDLLLAIYGRIDFSDTISCFVSYSKKKADIYVKVNDQVRGISIKKGVKNSVHVESLDQFCAFLMENGVSKRIIEGIRHYHYGDGTIDGTGTKRVSVSEYKVGRDGILKEINRVLNDRHLLMKAIRRFVLQGNNSMYEISAIIYGVVDDFVYITNEEIRYIIMKNRNIVTDSLHFGSLFYQNMARNLNYNPKYEKNRDYIQIKWYHLSDDIIEVMATYRKKHPYLD